MADEWGEDPIEGAQASGAHDAWGEDPVDSPAPPRVQAADPYDAFKQNYIEQAQRGPVRKGFDALATGAKSVLDLAKTAAGAVPGAMELYNKSTNPVQFAGDLAQTGIEGAGRGLYDTLNFARQRGADIIDNPKQLLNAGNPVMGVINDLMPSAPKEADIRKAYERDQTNQAYAEQRRGDVIPKLTGKANPRLAEATSLVADPISLAGGVGLVKAGVKMASASVERRAAMISSALNPGMRKAVNQETAKAIKVLVPKLDDFAKETGLDWSTPKGAADLGHQGKISTWDKVEELNGAPIIVDPTASAEKAFNVMAGSTPEAKAALLQFPGKQNALLREIEPFLQGPMTVKEMEANLQVLNARNRVTEAMTGVDKASATKANPVLKARMELAEGLREQLDNAMPGYADLKDQYKAWKKFTELSEGQAIRQAKLDGNLSLYQGLSFGPAMWSTVKSVATGNLADAAQAVGQLGVGKYAAYRRTPEYAFKKAASPYHKLRDSEAFRNGATVLATIGGKDFVVQYQGEVGGEKAKIKMQDGKVKTVDLYDLAPPPTEAGQ